MFVPVWMIFLASGTLMAVLVIVWGIRSNQFEEQDRARYLPLVGLSAREMAYQPPVRRGASFYALMVIVVSGVATLVATLALVLTTDVELHSVETKKVTPSSSSGAPVVSSPSAKDIGWPSPSVSRAAPSIGPLAVCCAPVSATVVG